MAITAIIFSAGVCANDALTVNAKDYKIRVGETLRLSGMISPIYETSNEFCKYSSDLGRLVLVNKSKFEQRRCPSKLLGAESNKNTVKKTR